jgi:MoaA/NifB/PqqE/SkfB family radical SAM enzyme
MLFTKPNYTSYCYYPFESLKIDSAGGCSFCCHHTRKCLGNILNSSLEDIWNSEIAQDIRTESSNNKLHSTCANEYCPFYHIRNDLKNRANKIKLSKLPYNIELDLPMQHCNVGGEDPKEGTVCIMCERARYYQKQEDRVDEICEKLQPYANNFKFLHIQGIAEAFWKNKLFDVVNKVGINPSNTRITTFTNGTILSGDKLDKWLNYPWTCLTFSIDASTPETFKKIRIWDAFHKVVENMKEFAKRRTSMQMLKTHNNINLLNVGEVKGMVELAVDIGVDIISFNPTYNLPGLSVDKSNVHIFSKAQDVINETTTKLGIKVEFMRSLTLDLQ